MSHMSAILVEQQDRAKHSRKLGLYNARQVLECFRQRSIAGYHLQNTALAVTQRFCPLALGHIHQGADDLSDFA